MKSGCYWYVKDTILKAIHNKYSTSVFIFIVVTDMSKIQFWKQFTTNNNKFRQATLLLLICQRYNFESNSQHPHSREFRLFCCYWYVKDTILKAIHNLLLLLFFSYSVVTDMSKIQFWKQFTTHSQLFHHWRRLLLICQRYNFESNSQLLTYLIM